MTSSLGTIYPQQLLGLHPSDNQISDYINSLASSLSKLEAAQPAVAPYPDAVYLNYHALGLSLLFAPQDGYKPSKGLKQADLVDEKLVLDGIDIYNVPKPKQPTALPSQPKPSSRSAELAFSTFPSSPIVLHLPAEDKALDVYPDSTGKYFVELLREPDRKGGGAGPSSGSINIWCEWSKKGLMVEFGGDDAKGPQAWERGKDAIWKVISIFPAKT